MVTTVSDSFSGNPEMWTILENLINTLILYGDRKNREIMKTIDYLFNSYEINKYIPNDFTSTLCLLINNIYLINQSQEEVAALPQTRMISIWK